MLYSHLYSYCRHRDCYNTSYAHTCIHIVVIRGYYNTSYTHTCIHIVSIGATIPHPILTFVFILQAQGLLSHMLYSHLYSYCSHKGLLSHMLYSHLYSYCRHRDYYHTCYALSGLSVSQNFTGATSTKPFVLGPVDNQLVSNESPYSLYLLLLLCHYNHHIHYIIVAI